MCVCFALVKRGELSLSVIHLYDGWWLKADSLIHSQRLISCTQVSDATCLSLPTTQWVGLKANQLASLTLGLKSQHKLFTLFSLGGF